MVLQLVCTAVIPEPFASLMFYTVSNKVQVNNGFDILWDNSHITTREREEGGGFGL